MDKFKTWTIKLFVIIIVICFIMAGLVFYVDPYFQYHKPLKTFPYIVDDQLTQNPGLARNITYDAVILGSSVTVNFDSSWFNEDFNLNTIKLPYNGAYPKDFSNITEQIELSNNELKYVFWTFDVAGFSGDTNEIKYPIKQNLYDTNPFNDISYLLNKDVLFEYIIFPFLNNKGSLSSDNYYFNNILHNAYASYMDLSYSREDCLNNFYSVNPDIDNEKVLRVVDELEDISIFIPSGNNSNSADILDDSTFLDAAKLNLEKNILPFIEAHPDTKFIISFPPYSILNWIYYANNGSINALIREYELVINELSKYNNVTIYYFCNDRSISYNLDLYTDSIHYNRDINHFMEQEFANPNSKYIITSLPENVY